MKVKQVAANIYGVSLAWSNAYVLTEGKEAVLIDTGLAQDRADLLAALQEIGVSAAHVRAVCLTHGHCDHAGNAAYFAGRSKERTQTEGGSRIYAHCAEARYLSLPRRTYAPTGIGLLRHPHTALAFWIGERRYPVERCGADVLLQEGEEVDAPGGSLRVIACPGHTPGHIAYFRERDGVLFSGDALMTIIPVRRVPGLSLPMPMFTENWTQAKQSVLRLAELRPSLLLPGHGWPLHEDTASRLSAWAKTLE